MKEKIQNMYIKAINDDLPPNVFADQVLRLFNVSGSAMTIDDEKDKHPTEQWDNGAPCYVCPNCNESDIGHGDNNCSSCGQRLEWHYH